jgi:hypothetical protein
VAGVTGNCGRAPESEHQNTSRFPASRTDCLLLSEPQAVNVRSAVTIRCPVMTVAMAIFHFTFERGEHLLPPRLERRPTPEYELEPLTQL